MRGVPASIGLDARRGGVPIGSDAVALGFALALRLPPLVPEPVPLVTLPLSTYTER
jgi:hypothetical protein